MGGPAQIRARTRVKWARWKDPPSAPAGGTSGSAARAPNEKGPGFGGRPGCGGKSSNGNQIRRYFPEPTVTPTAGKGKRSGTPLRERSARDSLPALGGLS